MARPLRIEYPGAVYHVTSRGDGREDIFLSDEDREMFLGVLSDVVDRYGFRCHAYCLMTNHYHLMVETPKANLSQGMRHLNGVFTQRLNRRHQRVGHVFQGRFKSILVEKDAHLLTLCSYIVRNPVAAGMVEDVVDWPWSSYQATAGIMPAPDFLTVSWVLDQFSGEPERYQQFVARQNFQSSPLAKAVLSNVLGSDEFLHKIQKDIKVHAELPREQRFVRRKAMGELMSGVEERGEWMMVAYREHGYTMREIAEFARLHYSTVSKVIKAWEAE